MFDTPTRSSLSLAVICAAFVLIAGATSAAAGDYPSGPEAAPDVYKVLAENDQWRVIEGTWQPGQEDNFHSHPADRVSLIKTDCQLQVTKLDGSANVIKPTAGKVIVRTGKPVAAHKAKNVGDSVCVIRIVELK